MSEDWPHGELAADLGLDVRSSAGAARRLSELAGLAVRHNERRRHLVVSTVLAKHVPVPASTVIRAADELGDLVVTALGAVTDCLVIGFCETATGLTGLVADRLAARGIAVDQVHSTRRRTDVPPVLEFSEPHSHAVQHVVAPDDERLLVRSRTVVLVDDELSTGRTVQNFLEALAAVRPLDTVVLASLLDLRPEADEVRLAEGLASGGTRVISVSLARASVTTSAPPTGPLDARLAAPEADPDLPSRGRLRRVAGGWAHGVPHRGEHGLAAVDRSAYAAELNQLADRLRNELGDSVRSVHVVGTEEMMYLPIVLAARLEQTMSASVTVSSTTRSPAFVLEQPGYPLRHGISFPSHDRRSDTGDRFLYNVPPGRHDVIVLVLDVDSAHADRLIDRLSRSAPELVLLVVDDHSADVDDGS